MRRRFFSRGRFDERSFSRKRSTGEQSHVSRNSKRVSVFFFFDEKRRRNDEKTTDAFAARASPRRLRDATDFCSGSSPRTATLSWAAASPAPSASSPTTTCPRARRASASDARSEVRARARVASTSPLLRARRARNAALPDRAGRPRGYPGRPGDARARPGTPRFDITHRPRAPPGAPGRPPPATSPPTPVSSDPFPSRLASRETADGRIRSRLEGLEGTRRAGREPRAGPPRRRARRTRARVARQRPRPPSPRGAARRGPHVELGARGGGSSPKRARGPAGSRRVGAAPRPAPAGWIRLRAVRRLRRRALRHGRVRRLPRVQGRICRRARAAARRARARGATPDGARPGAADVFTTPGDFAGGFAPSLLPLGGNGNPTRCR